MKTERRKHPRYRMKEEVMLFHDGNAGQVNNLSIGGCSCKCMVFENKLTRPTKLSIFCINGGDKVKLIDIPFDIVRNCINDFLPFTSSRTRKCGVKFGDIPSTQREQIALLISQHAKE